MKNIMMRKLAQKYDIDTSQMPFLKNSRTSMKMFQLRKMVMRKCIAIFAVMGNSFL
jgi:hypothetical protein